MGVIVAISGKKGSGKDTVADFLVQEFNFTKLSFAAPLKEVCCILFSMDPMYFEHRELKESWKHPETDMTPREILQYVGSDLMRKSFPNIWINIMKKKLHDRTKNYVISDLRFTNEYEFLRTLDHVTFLNMKRGSIETKDTHISENGLTVNDDFKIIENQGTKEELYDKIKKLL